MIDMGENYLGDLPGYRCKRCGLEFETMKEVTQHTNWKRIGKKFFRKCQAEEYSQIKAQTLK